MSAHKYYRREESLYRAEARWRFTDLQEVRRATDYLCRHFMLPYILVGDAKPGKPGYFVAAFRPEHYLSHRSSGLLIPTRYQTLYHLAHEFAHYMDYEDAIKDGRWRIRGLHKRYFRWHGRRHTEAMRKCVEVLRRRYRL